MFRTNRETDGIQFDALIRKFLFGELTVRGGRRMNDKTLDIGNVGKQRKNAQMINKGMGFF